MIVQRYQSGLKVWKKVWSIATLNIVNGCLGIILLRLFLQVVTYNLNVKIYIIRLFIKKSNLEQFYWGLRLNFFLRFGIKVFLSENSLYPSWPLWLCFFPDSFFSNEVLWTVSYFLFEDWTLKFSAIQNITKNQTRNWNICYQAHDTMSHFYWCHIIIGFITLCLNAKYSNNGKFEIWWKKAYIVGTLMG